MASKKVDPIPEDMSIDEASEFWDTHSVADYPSREVHFDYVPEGRVTLVAIAQDLLEEVQEQAKKRGVSVETLVNMWIQEKVAA